MKNSTAITNYLKHKAILAFIFLTQLFIATNMMSQESIEQESTKIFVNTNAEIFQILPELSLLQYQKNGFESLLDSSVRFVFETNYDSASYFKYKFEYNEAGLRKSWMFYHRVDNDPDKGWYLDSYFTYEYDDNDNMILQYTWYVYLQEFHQVEKNETTYNDLNQRIKSERYKRNWNEENWSLDSENFFDYDSIGNLSYHENWGFDDAWGEYRPFHKRYYKYDSINNLIQIHFYVWDRQDIEWKNLYKLNYSYDEQQNLILYIVTKWSSYNGIWWDAITDEMDYDNNNQQIKKASFERDNDTSAWQPTRKLNFDYDQDGYLIERIESLWMEDSMQLVNRMKNEYYYDQNGFLKEDLYFFWIIDTIIPSYWSLGWNISKINDSLGNILMDGFANWDSLSESWLYERKEYRYYSGFTVGHPEKLISDFKIYPNPTKGVFTIKSQSQLAERAEIYSLKAKLIYQIEIQSDVGFIDISNQKPGIYFLRVYFKNGTSYTTRIVKL